MTAMAAAVLMISFNLATGLLALLLAMIYWVVFTPFKRRAVPTAKE
jgi:hypothetical protein